MGTLSHSGSSADMLTAAASQREQSALDAFDALSMEATVGRAELARALWQVAETAMATSLQHPGKPSVAVSPGKRESNRQQLDDFLSNSERGSWRPHDFTSFVDLYNEFVDHVGLVTSQPPADERYASPSLKVETSDEDSPRMNRPPPRSGSTPGQRHSVMGLYDGSEAVDPRVRDKAASISAKMSMTRSERSPSGARSHTPGGARLSSTTFVASSADAPMVDATSEAGSVEGSRRRASVPSGRRGGAGSTSPLESPEFKRAGTQKFDFTSAQDRDIARQSYNERKKSSPGSSPITSRNASTHGGGHFSPNDTSPRGVHAAMVVNGALDALSVGAADGGGAAPSSAMTSPPGSRARSSAFRARRLSKDVVYDGDEGGEMMDARFSSGDPSPPSRASPDVPRPPPPTDTLMQTPPRAGFAKEEGGKASK